MSVHALQFYCGLWYFHPYLEHHVGEDENMVDSSKITENV